MRKPSNLNLEDEVTGILHTTKYKTEKWERNSHSYSVSHSKQQSPSAIA